MEGKSEDVTRRRRRAGLVSKRKGKTSLEKAKVHVYAHFNEILTPPEALQNPMVRLYKHATENGYPVRKTIYYSLDRIETLKEAVERTMKNNESFQSFFANLGLFNKTIQREDIVMVYYELISSSSEKQRLLNDLYEELGLDIQAANLVYVSSNYISWSAIFNTDAENTATIYEEIEYIVETLEEQKLYLNFSPFEIKRKSEFYQCFYQDVPIGDNNIMEVFDLARPSREVPLIIYINKNSRNFYRVFTGNENEKVLHYDMLIKFSKAANKPNSLYLVLWLENPQEMLMNESSLESFNLLRFDVDMNEIEIESEVCSSEEESDVATKEDNSFNRIRDALPGVKFISSRRVKTQGDFEVWDYTFYDIALLLGMIVDPVISEFLQIEEFNRPAGAKKRLKLNFTPLRYRDVSNIFNENDLPEMQIVDFTITPYRTPNEPTHRQTYDYVNNKSQDITLPPDTSYFIVHVGNSSSNQETRKFIIIFGLLLKYFKNKQERLDPISEQMRNISPEEDLLDRYLHFFPRPYPDKPPGPDNKSPMPFQEMNFGQVSKGVRSAQGAGYAKIHALHVAHPDMFGDNYARKCQPDSQPVPLTREEVPGFTSQSVVLGAPGERRQVIEYPKGSGYFFGCVEEQNAYPGLIVNDGPNKEKYPYYPVCRGFNQDTPGTEYYAYKNNKPFEFRPTIKGNDRVSVDKIIEANNIGSLPKNVETVLMEPKLHQYGVPLSINSFLHCICLASEKQEYMKLNGEEAEKFLWDLRGQFAKTMSLELGKQELYDYSSDEIYNLLIDTQQTFDPDLFYRFAEEYFDINIFVFGVSKVTSSPERLGYLVIPRHKFYHCRTYRPERNTVIISRVSGPAFRENYPYHYELVCQKIKKDIFFAYSNEMTKRCYKILYQTLGVVTVLQSGEVYDNLNYSFAPNKLPGEAKSQHIDSYGKLRMLEIEVKGKNYYVAIPPSQPENLPLVDEVKFPTLDDVRKLFPDFPYGIEKDDNGKMSGIWFSVRDLNFGIFFPIVPIDIPSEYLELPREKSPIDISDVVSEEVSRLIKLRSTSDFIYQLIMWVFDIYRLEFGTDNIFDFTQKYMVVESNPPEDSLTYYDLSALTSKLPVYKSTEEALSYLRNLLGNNGLVDENNKLLIYNFNFYQGIKSMAFDHIAATTRFNKESKALEPIVPSSFIRGFYKSAKDFSKNKEGEVFVGEQDFNNWLQAERTFGQGVYNIHQNIKFDPEFQEYPYFYENPDGKIYLLQLTQLGNLISAITLSYLWRKDGINYGFNYTATLDFEPAHIINRVGHDGLIGMFKDKSEGEESYIEVLLFVDADEALNARSGRYAAMLPIN